MRFRISRTLTGALLIVAIGASSPRVVTVARGAGVAAPQRLVLLASLHKGRIIADLGEQVIFIASTTRPMAGGQAIAIVSTKTDTLLNLCQAAPCLAVASSAGASVDTDQAFLFSEKGSNPLLTTSNAVTVEWKALSMQVKITDPVGTLKAEAPGTAGIDRYVELRGVPITATVTFPNGVSTAWTKVTMTGTTTTQSEQSCTLKQRCQLTLQAPDTATINAGNVSTDLEVGGTVVKQALSLIDYRPWTVNVTGTNNSTGASSPASLSLSPSETGKISTKVNEASSGGLDQYVNRIEIRSRAPGSPPTDKGAVIETCPHTLTCTHDLDGASISGSVVWAEVLGKDSTGGGPLLEGRGNDVAVSTAAESTSCSASVKMTATTLNPTKVGEFVTVAMVVTPDLTGTNCTIKLQEKDSKGYIFETCASKCAWTFPGSYPDYLGACTGSGECVLSANLLNETTGTYTNVGVLTINWP